jgi:hypothetical protein
MGNRDLLPDTGTRVALTDTGNRDFLTDTGNRVLPRTQNCGLVEAPILDHKGVQPPPEPPPTPILDHADVGPPPEPPPECTVAVTRLTIPLSHAPVCTPSPTPHRSLLDGVTYTVPLEKGRPPPKTVPCFPQGSLSNPGILIRPASPTTPFEFPFPMVFDDAPTSFSNNLDTLRLPMDSVTRVIGLPRVFGLCGDTGSYACVTSRVNNTSTGPASGCSRSMSYWTPRTPRGR